MVSSSRIASFSDANAHVQEADHLLESIYPLSRDPKTLIAVIDHEQRAIESAIVAFRAQSAASETPALRSAAALRDRLGAVLQQHASAHTVFTRRDARVIVGDDFQNVTMVDMAGVAEDLRRVKAVVHELGTQVLRDQGRF